MIYLSSPHMGPCERELLLDAFDSNWVAPLGPYVDQFESDFAKYIGVPYAVALSSGTAALHLALLVLGVKPGDKVLTSTLTFVATANAIKYVGAEPIFVDCEKNTWNMDPSLLGEELHRIYARGERVAAVVPVDLYGRPADYGAILDICTQYDILVIEDAAEALGATYNSKKAGNFGKMAAFSFNGNKIMTTGGGGMLVSENKVWADKARYLATQARMPVPHYQHEDIGFNYRLSNLSAALGCGQLQVLDEHIARRREIHERYLEELANLMTFPCFSKEVQGGFQGNYWLTTALIDSDRLGKSPEELRQYLWSHQIESRPIWKPMHLQPVFQGCQVLGGKVSEEIFKMGLCLPSGSNLTDQELSQIIVRIKEFHVS